MCRIIRNTLEDFSYQDFNEQPIQKNLSNKSKIFPRRQTTCRNHSRIGAYTSSFDKWVKQATLTGSFKEKDNLNLEQVKLIALRKKKINNSKWRMIFLSKWR